MPMQIQPYTHQYEWNYEIKAKAKTGLTNRLTSWATGGFFCGIALLLFSLKTADKTVVKTPQKEKTAVKWKPNCTESEKKYIERFAKTAKAEARMYQIPASITLAQGILESNCGNSSLAKDANNHFGIQCFSKKCPKGHCINHSDNTHKDFFVVYKSAWESFREHSKLLGNPRYKSLKETQVVENWAHGLSSCGYAKDPKYADKLLEIVESCDLKHFDK